ncbi:hypothetical protein B0T20DRAFT_241387 [Sordaria brevicollis]|uniref:Uncharacterized protein n=1 Tax=Sordaria brevicollis TaxID=83679 RepID=A0AAE0PDQ3_SORBR|nr:hypothetical protein B0T20DRAFT_241387 [Sordaria brevicollis]
MASSLRELEADPALYIYTSLTAGSSHIVTATSRLETILRANRIPFKAVDMATNDKARMLWGRRAGKDPNGRVRKLPALVQEGFVVGDIVEIEEWNEYGELKQHVTIFQDEFTQPPIGSVPPKPKYGKKKKKADASHAEASSGNTSKTTKSATSPESSSGMAALPIRTLAEEAAAKAKEKVAAAAKAVSTATKQDGTKKEKEDDKVKEEVEKPTAASLAPSATIESSGTSTAAAASKTPKAVTVEDEEDPEAGNKTATTTETKSEEATTTTTTKPTTESATTTNPIPIPTPKSPAAATSHSPAVPAAAFGLQSPTSGGWKDDSGASRTVQSPTSTTWQPTDVDAPITSIQGAMIASASEEEIKAIERAQTIKEVPDEEVEE